MQTSKQYQCAIVGGGLAGLALAIQLSKASFKVILFEKNAYPMHKVCGEYISKESEDFLSSLGVDLASLSTANICKLEVSSNNGSILRSNLDMGGIGISRFMLDNILAQMAIQSGVELRQNTTVVNVQDNNKQIITSLGEEIETMLTVYSYGKISNLERLTQGEDRKTDNEYVGIKYHINTQFPRDTIALHNFQGGYCGISAIEDDKYCLCYLIEAKYLKQYKGDIKLMEQKLLSRNPYLKKIFSESQFLTNPIATSQIRFRTKKTHWQDALILGDAAGSIAPLCGNGMSMALRASKIAFEQISNFLYNRQSQEQMVKNYHLQWKKSHALRIKVGETLQSFFGKVGMSNFMISSLRHTPYLVKQLIKMTHGKSF